MGYLECDAGKTSLNQSSEPAFVITMPMPSKKHTKRKEMKAYAERRSRQKSRGGSTATPIQHSDVITDVVQYLGIRSLVRFGATRKSNRAAVAKEVERAGRHA